MASTAILDAVAKVRRDVLRQGVEPTHVVMSAATAARLFAEAGPLNNFWDVRADRMQVFGMALELCEEAGPDIYVGRKRARDIEDFL